MIKLEHIETYGWESAIRGLRNPMNSWDKSDSYVCPMLDEITEKNKSYRCAGCRNEFMRGNETCYVVGDNDLMLMKKLCKAGTDHRKFMRMIVVSMDITAPLYWWKEYDTYKVGTVANSCSTMHKIHSKEFTMDDFSHEHLFEHTDHYKRGIYWDSANSIMMRTIESLNLYRNLYIKTKDKEYWWQMIQLLPSSYNQKRTVQLNYEVLTNIYHARKNHKLDEWRELCKEIEKLPYSELITE